MDAVATPAAEAAAAAAEAAAGEAEAAGLAAGEEPAAAAAAADDVPERKAGVRYNKMGSESCKWRGLEFEGLSLRVGI